MISFPIESGSYLQIRSNGKDYEGRRSGSVCGRREEDVEIRGWFSEHRREVHLLLHSLVTIRVIDGSLIPHLLLLIDFISVPSYHPVFSFFFRFIQQQLHILYYVVRTIPREM